MYSFRCPYCDTEINLAHYESDEFDMECACCEKEIEVKVEYTPEFSAFKIELGKCCECGKNVRVGLDGINQNTCPWPDKYKNTDVLLCKKCWAGYLMDYLVDGINQL